MRRVRSWPIVAPLVLVIVLLSLVIAACSSSTTTSSTTNTVIPKSTTVLQPTTKPTTKIATPAPTDKPNVVLPPTGPVPTLPVIVHGQSCITGTKATISDKNGNNFNIRFGNPTTVQGENGSDLQQVGTDKNIPGGIVKFLRSPQEVMVIYCSTQNNKAWIAAGENRPEYKHNEFDALFMNLPPNNATVDVSVIGDTIKVFKTDNG